MSKIEVDSAIQFLSQQKAVFTQTTGVISNDKLEWVKEQSLWLEQEFDVKADLKGTNAYAITGSTSSAPSLAVDCINTVVRDNSLKFNLPAKVIRDSYNQIKSDHPSVKFKIDEAGRPPRRQKKASADEAAGPRGGQAKLGPSNRIILLGPKLSVESLAKALNMFLKDLKKNFVDIKISSDKDDSYFPGVDLAKFGITITRQANPAMVKLSTFKPIETISYGGDDSPDVIADDLLVRYLRNQSLQALRSGCVKFGGGFSFQTNRGMHKLSIFTTRDRVGDWTALLQIITGDCKLEKIPILGLEAAPKQLKDCIQPELRELGDIEASVNGSIVNIYGPTMTVDNALPVVRSWTILQRSWKQLKKVDISRLLDKKPNGEVPIQELTGKCTRAHVDTDKNELNLFGVSKESFDEAVENIEAFLLERAANAPTTDYFDIKSWSLARICLFHEETREKMLAIAKEQAVTLKFPPNIQKVTKISLRGKKAAVDALLAAFKSFVNGAVKSNLGTTAFEVSAGEFGLLASKEFNAEQRKSFPATDVEGSDKQQSDAIRPGMVRHVKLPSGITLQIRQGDIINDLDMESIISAAGPKLQHGGGVAARISLAAGQSYVDACNQYVSVQPNQELNSLTACWFQGFNMPIKGIVNVVPPVFFEGETPVAQAESNLAVAFENAILTADQKGATSISLPAIGAQLFKNPVDSVCKAFFACIKKLIAPGLLKNIKLIRFTDINSGNVATFKQAFDAEYGKVNGVRKWKSEKVEIPTVQYPDYQWYWEEDGPKWVKYDDDSNWMLDTAFKQKAARLPMNISVSRSGKGKNYEVNFAAMKQYNVASGFSRNMKKETFDVPADASAANSEDDDDDDDDDAEDFVPEKDGSARKFTIQVTYFRDQLQNAVRDVRAALKTTLRAITFEVKSLPTTVLDNVTVACTNQLVDIDDELQTTGKLKITLSGSEERINKAKMAILEESMKHDTSRSIKYPREWTAQQQPCELVSIAQGSAEWLAVDSRMRATLPTLALFKVERIQNRKIYELYSVNKQILTDKLGSAPDTKLLCHGTRSTPPSAIYATDLGFAFQFASTGMWGMLYCFTFS